MLFLCKHPTIHKEEVPRSSLLSAHYYGWLIHKGKLSPRSCRIWVLLKDALQGEGYTQAGKCPRAIPAFVLAVSTLLWICDFFPLFPKALLFCLKWSGLTAIAYNWKYFTHIGNLKESHFFKNHLPNIWVLIDESLVSLWYLILFVWKHCNKV